MRILCLVGKMDLGGAETFLMKQFRESVKKEIIFDFLVFSQDRGKYDDEIIRLGGLIHHSVPKTKRPIESFLTIKNIVKKYNYSHVIRISQNAASIIDLLAAKFGGAKIRAFRSSNTAVFGLLNNITHVIFKPLVPLIANKFIAPSSDTATYMFGQRKTRNHSVSIIKNAIDIDRFTFDFRIRNLYRKMFGISDNAFVIGHVGRFNNQKNQKKIIEIFSCFYQKNSNSVLVLVGKGETRAEIENQISKHNIRNSVVILDDRNDIQNVMMIFDVLLFPSLFEGMPNVVIEAQFLGLVCYVSDTITREVEISNGIKWIDINESPDNIAGIITTNYKPLVYEEYRYSYDIKHTNKLFLDAMEITYVQ